MAKRLIAPPVPTKVKAAWGRRGIDFLREESLSAAFQKFAPWLWGTVTTATLLVWQIVIGPLGPLFIAALVIVFFTTVIAVALVIAVRTSAATNERVAVIAATAQIPQDERGILDFGAGLEAGIKEFNIVVPQLSKELNKITAKVHRHNKLHTQAVSSASFTKRREMAIAIAKDLDKNSKALEPRVVRIENAGAVLSEGFVGLAELADDSETGALQALRSQAGTFQAGAQSGISGMESFRNGLSNLKAKRIQQHLSQSAIRMKTLVERIIAALHLASTSCERVIKLVDRKSN